MPPQHGIVPIQGLDERALFEIDGRSAIECRRRKLSTRVPVRLGRASVTVIEVNRGLAEGDQVVLSDTAQWDKYDRLKLQ